MLRLLARHNIMIFAPQQTDAEQSRALI